MADIDRREFIAAVGLGAATGFLGTERPVLRDGDPSFEEGLISQGRPPSEQGPDPWIELDSGALRHNLSALRQVVGERPIMAVIKGNGYGHGLIEMGRMLRAENIEHVAVGKVSEALALREDWFRGTILNFGPFASRDVPDLVQARVSQTVFTDQVREIAEEGRRRGEVAPVQVNIDTGLGRVGVPYREALSFLQMIASLEGVQLEGVFTALTEDPEFDRVQLERFLGICEEAEETGIDVGLKHAASSAAVMDNPDSFLDMVRPGISVYGHYPSDRTWEERPIDLAPVLSLKTRVVYVKTLQTGDALSYHRAFVAEKPTRIATLPIGYSDGYPHTLAGKAEVLIRGRRFPIVALITANHTLVNLGDDGEIEIGDEAVLIGRQAGEEIDAHRLGAAAGVSVYKIVIGMMAGLPRIIV